MVSHVGRRTAAARVAAEAVTPLVGFAQVKHAVAAQFTDERDELFRTTVDKDLLWDSYLASFPEGSNPCSANGENMIAVAAVSSFARSVSGRRHRWRTDEPLGH